jgi:hypothetical protein
MERAARAFQKHKLSKPLLTEEDVLRAAWRAAVGKIVARHTSRVRLVRTTLVVEVEDAIWQRQLNGLWHQILEQVRHTTGDTTLEHIEFRIAVPRREAQRALSPNETATAIYSDSKPGFPAGGAQTTSISSPKVSSASSNSTARENSRAGGTSPALATQNTLWSGEPGMDESDQIQDPVLKKVYQLSRRKASA